MRTVLNAGVSAEMIPFSPSRRKAGGLSGTYDRTDQPWIPALRFAAAGMTLSAASCSANAQDACLDDGGVWDATTARCFCSRQQTNANEQLRTWCADLTNLDSIKKKAAAIPAPTGD